VSFGTHERRVRDPSLRYGLRISALVGCVERYSPIGFHITFGYLEHVAGPFRRDEAALLRAMDLLSSSRALWRIELTTETNRRKAAKRRGQRNLSAPELELKFTPWYGDARNAAMFALGFLLRSAGENRNGQAQMIDAAVLRMASTCLDGGGRLSGADLEQVHRLRSRFQHLRVEAGWPHMRWLDWRRAHDSLWALHLITTVCTPPGR